MHANPKYGLGNLRCHRPELVRHVLTNKKTMIKTKTKTTKKTKAGDWGL